MGFGDDRQMHVHKVSASAHPSPPAAPPRAPHCRQPRPGASQQATGCPAVRGPPPCSATARQQGAPSGMASHSGSELVSSEHEQGVSGSGEAQVPGMSVACSPGGRTPVSSTVPINPPCPQRVLEVDPMLQSHAEHLRYRFQQYQNTRGSIERHAGSLLNFARVGRVIGVPWNGRYAQWPAGQLSQHPGLNANPGVRWKLTPSP